MNTKNVLITGITGFIGTYIAEKYLSEGNHVYGNLFARDELPPPKNKLLHLYYCDIRNERQIRKLVHVSQPDIVIHLAAQSYPIKSWQDPKYTMDTNVNGTLNLFSAVLKEKLDPIILVACSSAEYGYTAFKTKRPLKENDQLLPVHPYGLSKVCQDLLSQQYFVNYGMKILRARIFNTIGPGKKNDFLGDVSIQIAKIRKGKQKPIVKVGNLDTRRDMTDVRDQISALSALIKSGKLGEVYNICSGKSVKMRDLLHNMILMVESKIKIQVDPNKVRLVDEPIIVGDPSKIRKDCHWKPAYSMKNTLKDSVDFWNK